MFDWTVFPPSRSPCGAILLKNNKEYLVKNGFTLGWLKELYLLLDVDYYWLRRFWLDFDRGYQVEICEFDKKGNLVKTSLDDISALELN